MDYRKKILKLANFLGRLGLTKEASEILSIIKNSSLNKSEDIELWYGVLNEINAPYDDTFYASAQTYLVSAANYMKKAKIELSGITEQDIKNIIDNIPIGKIISSASRKNNLYKVGQNDPDAFKKISELCISNGWIERPNYKKANWWSNIKMVGGATVRYVIPFLGLLFALINLYYCSIELSKLFYGANDIGLEWYEPIFYPEKTFEITYKNLKNPEELDRIVGINKAARTFADELISLFANTIDGIKDIVFMIIDIMSGGGSIPLDLGISVFIMIVEFFAEAKLLPFYDKITNLIREEAIKNIKLYHASSMQNRISEKFEEIDELEESFI